MGEALSVAMRLAITIISSTALAPVFQSGSLFFKQGRNAREFDPCDARSVRGHASRVSRQVVFY